MYDYLSINENLDSFKDYYEKKLTSKFYNESYTYRNLNIFLCLMGITEKITLKQICVRDGISTERTRQIFYKIQGYLFIFMNKNGNKQGPYKYG